jgi:hypothetical protein
MTVKKYLIRKNQDRHGKIFSMKLIYLIIMFIVTGCSPTETYNMSDIRSHPISFDEQYSLTVMVDLSKVLDEMEGNNSAKITCGNSYIKLLKKSLPSMFKKVTFKSQPVKKNTDYEILLVPSFTASFSTDRLSEVSKSPPKGVYRIENNVQYNMTVIVNGSEISFFSKGSNTDQKTFEESDKVVAGVNKTLPWIYMGDISASMLPSISTAFNDLLKKIYNSEELIKIQKTAKKSNMQPAKLINEDEDVIDWK